MATWLVGPMTRPTAKSILQRIHFMWVTADLRCDVGFMSLFLVLLSFSCFAFHRGTARKTGISTKLWTVPSLNNPLPTISPRLLTVTANMESKSQLEPAGKNVVRSIPWLVALGQRKGRCFEKSSLYPMPTICPLSLMPAATALVNSPTVLRIIAGLELLAQNTARSAEKSDRKST